MDDRELFDRWADQIGAGLEPELEEMLDSPAAVAEAGGLAPLGASGLYELRYRPPLNPAGRPGVQHGPPPGPLAGPDAAAAAATVQDSDAVPDVPLVAEELRLDVDGRYPQMIASGTLYRYLTERIHWVARLAPIGLSSWIGRIWHRNGDLAIFPYTDVEIHVTRSPYPGQRTARVGFSGGGVPNRVRALPYASPYFRRLELEPDAADAGGARPREVKAR